MAASVLGPNTLAWHFWNIRSSQGTDETAKKCEAIVRYTVKIVTKGGRYSIRALPFVSESHTVRG
jgi:hypothetical protein